MAGSHRSYRSLGLALGMAASLVTGFLVFATPALAAPEDADKLRESLNKAYQAKDYTKALGIAEKIQKIDSDDAENIYNLACLHCLLGHKDKAYDWLEKAIDGGYKDADHLVGDSDFSKISGDDRFRTLVKKCRAQGKGKDGEKPSASDKKPKRGDDDGDDDDKPAAKNKSGDEKPKLTPQETAEKVQELAQKVVEASENKDYKKGLELARKANDLAETLKMPQANQLKALTRYNVACMYSQNKDKDKAFEYLESSLKAGAIQQDMVKQIEGDTDFNNIRKDPRYKKMIALAKSKSGGDEDGDDDDKPAAKEKPADKEKSEGDEKLKLNPQQTVAKIGEITQQMMKASEGKEYKKAMDLARKANALAESIDDPRMNGQKSLTRYNLACMSSLLKEKDKAFEYLESSLKIGGFQEDMVKQIETDTDFDNIRSDSRYKKMLELAKSGGAAGKKVDFKWNVTLPGGEEPSKPAPLIVALHGMNGNMGAMTARWKKAAEKTGAILLSVQGTRQMGEGKFAWGENMDRIEKDLTEVIEKLMDEHKIDRKKVIITGFSQGGSVTYAMAMRSPDVFCGAIPVAGRFAPADDSMLTDKDFKKQRFFIMVGEKDRDEIVASNKKAAKQLEKAGLKVKLNVYDDVAHEFPENSDEETVKAIKFVLGE